MSRPKNHRSPAILSVLILLMLVPAVAAVADSHAERQHRLTHIARGAEGHLYALSDRNGALRSENRGRDWKAINQGLPRDQVWPFDQQHYRRFTSLSLDSSDPQRLAATTSAALYTSTDAGRSWSEIPLRNPVKSKDYLTAVSFDPNQAQRMYLGTSFNGLYRSEDGGASWKKESEHLDELYRGAGFYEEITDLAMVPGRPNELFIASAFDKLIFCYNTADHSVTSIDLPPRADELLSINNYSGGVTDDPALEVHFRDARGVFNLKTEKWSIRPPLLRSQSSGRQARQDGEEGGRAAPDPASRKTADHTEIQAIYLNAYNVTGERFDAHLEFMKEHGFNGIVVDVKDDWGRLTYGSQLDRPAEIGAVHTVFDLEELVEKAHREGIYVIGRMVVFKDQRLYRANRNKYAIWDAKQDAPWRHTVPEKYEEDGEEKTRQIQREFWTDPFSEEVWDYNIAIAQELQAMGIDEIQFDYIRFPSDGDLSTARFRYRKSGMLKTEAIESFAKKVSSKIDIPISADLYGFNSWYRMGNWIGQDIVMIGEYFDVICPMYYPSHFPYRFFTQDDYIERAFEIYKVGTERAQRFVGAGTSVRPYVQAFLMGSELKMEESEYFSYLNRQLEGILHAEGGGYTLWNNMNKYYMVNGMVVELNRKLMDPDENTL